MKTGKVLVGVLGTILRLACTVFIIYGIYRGALVCYEYGYRVFTEPAVAAGDGRTVTVTIPAGMTAGEMGELFVQKGLVKDEKLFILQYHLSEFKEGIRPGTFDLSTAMTAEEMMEAMTVTEEGGDDN